MTNTHLLVVGLGAAILTAGCSTSSMPPNAACDLVRSSNVAAVMGAVSGSQPVTSDSGPPEVRGCAVATAQGGFELWYLHQGGTSMFNQAHIARMTDPALRRVDLPSLGFPAFEERGPSAEVVYALKHGRVVEVTIGPRSVAGVPDQKAVALAASLVKAVP